MLVGKSQTLELHPMDAGYAFLQNALSALHRSAQPSRNVMFIGTGIASQQAEHARQIFNAVRVFWPLYAQRHCLQKLNEKAERKYYTVLEFKILMMALAIIIGSYLKFFVASALFSEKTIIHSLPTVSIGVQIPSTLPRLA